MVGVSTLEGLTLGSLTGVIELAITTA